MDKQSSTNNDVISVLEVWEAIGHDTGINPDKEELLESLRNMAAICNAHGNDMPAQSAIDQRQVIADAITGALAFGALASRPPAEDHWLRPFYDLGAAEGQRTRDLAMLVRMLASALKRHAPDSNLVERAANYLAARGLVGTPLRSALEPEKRGDGDERAAFEACCDYVIDPDAQRVCEVDVTPGKEAELPEVVAYADPIAFATFKERGHEGGAVGREWMWAEPSAGLVAMSRTDECERVVGALLRQKHEADTALAWATRHYQKVEQQRDAALARCAELKAELAMANDAAAKGDAARHQCAGMEMEIKELRGAADHSELRRIAVALKNPLLSGDEASDLMVRYEALTMPDHIIALIDSQALHSVPEASEQEKEQGWTLDYRFVERVTDLAASRTEYTTSMEATEQVLLAARELLAAAPGRAQPGEAQYSAPAELRAICMLVAEAGIKYGRGRHRAVASDECREVVDSVLPLEPSRSNSEQHCLPEIMAVAEGVLTFMRSEKDNSQCTCCNGPHIFCRYFDGMSDFDDITLKARFRNDLEGRTFRLVLELLPAGGPGKEGV
ncbi:hypothetical protein ACM7UX_26610 [Pseudomonas aeruginosa]